MKIIVKGSDTPGLDGEYVIEPEPTTREITRFRKEFGLSPNEMTEVISKGSIEVVPFYIYTALNRQGRELEASQLNDLPFDTWGNADVAKEGDDTPTSDDEPDAVEEAQLPPT